MQVQSSHHDATVPPRFSLRPLTTGETLDRSFALFRASFPLCIGISMVPALLAVAQAAIRAVYVKVAHLSPLTPAWSSPGLGLMLGLFSVLSFFAFGWSSAGICWAVSRFYLNRPVTVRDTYNLVLRHWFRYPALLVLQTLRAAWLPIILYAVAFGLVAATTRLGGTTAPILGGLVMVVAGLSLFVAIYLYIRLAVAMPAAIIEDLSPTAALRRSKDLLQTRKGRVFALLILIGVFYAVISAVVGFLGVAFIRGHLRLVALQAVGLVVSLLSSLLLQPLLMVALCVVYYDERVRREGYDLQALMEQPDSTAQAAWAYPLAPETSSQATL